MCNFIFVSYDQIFDLCLVIFNVIAVDQINSRFPSLLFVFFPILSILYPKHHTGQNSTSLSLVNDPSKSSMIQFHCSKQFYKSNKDVLDIKTAIHKSFHFKN